MTGDAPGTSGTVAPTRARPPATVQAVGRRPADVERRRWESAAVLAFFTVAYSLLGYWLVVDLHVVGFETLDRWSRALMVTANEPPKLAAVGFDYPPLVVLLLAPFAAVPSLTASLVVVPVVSALFAAFTMVVLNTMMRRARITLPARLAVLAGLGLNPLVVMYAATGGRDFLWLAFLVAALGGLFAWYVTADIRFVMVAGVAFAVAALAGYSSLVWFAVSLVMVAAVLVRLGADAAEVEGTTVGLAAPTVYVVALWSAFNLIVLARPLDWVTSMRSAPARGGAGDVSLLDAVHGTGDLLLHGAPIAIVVLPALVCLGVLRRNVFALWLAVMLLVAILLPGITALARLSDAPMRMDAALPMLLLAVVGALWLARSTVHTPALVAGVLALGLLLSIPWTFAAMPAFAHQGLERAFHDAVSTGRSQEGARTPDGAYVGYDLEQQVADYVTSHVETRDAVLTDNAATYAVILLSGAPRLFLDRVDRSDDAWAAIAADPGGHVRYLLLSVDTSRDALSRRYPAAAAGRDPVLRPVFANDRYVLVAVPGDQPLVPQPGATS